MLYAAACLDGYGTWTSRENRTRELDPAQGGTGDASTQDQDDDDVNSVVQVEIGFLAGLN